MNRKAKKYEVTTDELLRIIEDVGEIPDEQTPHWLQGAG